MEAAKMDFSTTEKEKFRSTHFDEPNILVHLRLNDRTGPNGEKVLFIEELQSDWGQQGKKKGFRTGDIDNLEKELRSLEQEREAIRLAHTEKYRHTRQTREEYDRLDIELNQRDASIRRLRDRINLARYGTPQAPFVTSTDAWVELGLKQAIRMAVQGGYDKIAWTTGEQQNERYDLSKQVDAVGYDGNTLWVQEKGSDGFSIMRSDVPENKIADYIGKDAAAKLSESNKSSGDIRYIEGDDLKVGGSGMKGFYDKILPNMAGKVGRKL
ncbi:MAG TPA: hypothetical protein PLY13_07930, partial [Methanoregulaceae archaeon]|nr:hypothetical protein [Methanoregulaceae archaeon]